MKTLQYGLLTMLLTASLSSVATESLKKDIIEYQQKQVKEEFYANEKASPESEARPAVTTSNKKHSVQSPKAEMIKSQQKATEKAMKDDEAAKPEVETRPAATATQK